MKKISIVILSVFLLVLLSIFLVKNIFAQVEPSKWDVLIKLFSPLLNQLTGAKIPQYNVIGSMGDSYTIDWPINRDIYQGRVLIGVPYFSKLSNSQQLSSQSYNYLEVGGGLKGPYLAVWNLLVKGDNVTSTGYQLFPRRMGKPSIIIYNCEDGVWRTFGNCFGSGPYYSYYFKSDKCVDFVKSQNYIYYVDPAYLSDANNFAQISDQLSQAGCSATKSEILKFIDDIRKIKKFNITKSGGNFNITKSGGNYKYSVYNPDNCPVGYHYAYSYCEGDCSGDDSAATVCERDY